MIDTSTHATRAEFYSSPEWRRLRDAVIERDHHECQWCKAEGKVTTDRDTVLEVDHIKTVEEHPECAYDMNNMRTLCKDCHNKRHQRFNYKPHGPRKQNKWATDERW
ncbi:HNH endonuclease [Lacticaseibacillus saniviri]